MFISAVKYGRLSGYLLRCFYFGNKLDALLMNLKTEIRLSWVKNVWSSWLPLLMRMLSSLLISSPWMGASTSSNSRSSGAVSASLTASCWPPAEKKKQTREKTFKEKLLQREIVLLFIFSYRLQLVPPVGLPAAGPGPETPAAAGGSAAAGSQSPAQEWCVRRPTLRHKKPQI